MPTWISHRGVRDKGAAENSMASFKRARVLGFKYFETDLHQLADGNIILSHDPTIHSDAGQLFLPSSTTEEVCKFSEASGRDFLFWNDFVAEFSDIDWTLDIKPTTATKVIASLAAKSGDSDVCGKPLSEVKFLVWSKGHEAEIRKKWPRANLYAGQRDCYRIGLTLLSRLHFLLPRSDTRTFSVPASFAGLRLFRKQNVSSLHLRGMKALAFLPSTREQIDQAIAANFDEILVDYNEGLMKGYDIK